ncbi:hypothetical protein BV20DRAFT_1058489 [Pilatotrama ljubarskyi]|nr:hypothetical protein BV20DRAFT_1058489 [Pilatotrama ljubarskyi]
MFTTPSMSATERLCAKEAELEALRREAEEEIRMEKARKAEEMRKAEEARNAEEEKRKVEEARKKKTEGTLKAAEASKKRKAVAAEDDSVEVGPTIEVPQPDGKLPLVFYVPRQFCNRCMRLSLECWFGDGPRTSSCVPCQKRQAKCKNAKGITDMEIQAHHNRKQEEPTSPAPKQAKKSTATAGDGDEKPTPTPSAAKGKGKEVAGPSSAKVAEKTAEKSAGKDTEDGAEEGAENAGNDLRVSLARKGRSWSADPTELSDRELLDHLLVEGQKTRRAIAQLYRFLDEEVELCKELVTEDLRLIKGAVTKAVDSALRRWMDSEVRRVVREEVQKAFAEHLTEEGEEGEGEDVEGEEDEAE